MLYMQFYKQTNKHEFIIHILITQMHTRKSCLFQSDQGTQDLLKAKLSFKILQIKSGTLFLLRKKKIPHALDILDIQLGKPSVSPRGEYCA